MNKINISWICLLLSSISCGWNATGHRVVAQIAYAELSQPAKQALKKMTSNFSFDNIYPDKIKARNITAYNHWHYIGLPYSPDHTATNRPARENAVWAMNQQIELLANKNINAKRRRQALRFYSHILADIHQPLHCIETYTRQNKHGDKGGNRFPIRSRVANNLHAYWDRGGGLLNHGGIRSLVSRITSRWPRRKFYIELQEESAQAWAKASHQIARESAYRLSPGQRPNWDYQHRTKKITEKQLALAGYRLADQLNKLLTD